SKTEIQSGDARRTPKQKSKAAMLAALQNRPATEWLLGYSAVLQGTPQFVMADRLQSEQQFHDQQARQRAEACPDVASLVFDDAHYLHHENWIIPALAQLGDIRGRAVLDYGCGHGMAAVVLARRGARVVAFDLSRGYLREAHARARANGVDIAFVQA